MCRGETGTGLVINTDKNRDAWRLDRHGCISCIKGKYFLMFYSWEWRWCMATHELSHFSVLIYSSPVWAWLGPDNSETAWRADTTPQRVIQAVITPSKKHGNAGELKNPYQNAIHLSTQWVSSVDRLPAGLGKPEQISGPSVLVLAVLAKKNRNMFVLFYCIDFQ